MTGIEINADGMTESGEWVHIADYVIDTDEIAEVIADPDNGIGSVEELYEHLYADYRLRVANDVPKRGSTLTGTTIQIGDTFFRPTNFLAVSIKVRFI